jgi:hypothetical protein
MNDPRKDGTRAVPFRRLVRTSSTGAASQAAQHREHESEYDYGCVEWYQYPGEAAWSARRTQPRGRAARR